MSIPAALTDYPNIVRSGKIKVCREQKQLIEMVDKRFYEESLFFDEKRFDAYMSYQKYFPFDLIPWEVFIFALHDCVFRNDGLPRWPTLFAMVGRGSGKNGFLSYENFCLLTPANGIRNYHIDTFATAEDQAKVSFDEIYEILESTPRLKKFFKWNKEVITSLQTGSEYRFKTSNAKTKDSGRQGKVDFDEVHQFENYKLINVATSGLGKKPHPRRTFITSDGYVREGPLDDLKRSGRDILSGIIDDNGMLPFMCRIESKEEIDDKTAWVKAIPSLDYMPNLKAEVIRAYGDYKMNPYTNTDFPTKRLNFPIEKDETKVTDYKNLLKTKKEIVLREGQSAVLGFDYAAKRDFAAVGYLTKAGELYQWKCKGFVLRGNPDLTRINAPLEVFEQKGEISFVDGEEITPKILMDWILNEQVKHGLVFAAGALDYFRYAILKKELTKLGLEPGRDGNLKLVRPSDLMIVSPIIASVFDRGQLACGDNQYFRWCTNNVKITMDKRGNEIYEKIEPKSRKTDAFMAYAAAMTMQELLPEDSTEEELDEINPIFY